MTQIANLRQIDGKATVFAIAKGSVFRWSMAFPYPAGPQVPLVAAAALTAGLSILSGLPADTVASLVTGQIVVGYGVPEGATVVGFPSPTSVAISAPVTQAGSSIAVTFWPLPLDLTGISFRMRVKRTMSLADQTVLLDMSTDNGLLINGGPTGILACYVPPTGLARLTQVASPYVTDILAWAADGGPLNLMAQSGPAAVNVIEGVTLC